MARARRGSGEGDNSVDQVADPACEVFVHGDSEPLKSEVGVDSRVDVAGEPPPQRVDTEAFDNINRIDPCPGRLRQLRTFQAQIRVDMNACRTGLAGRGEQGGPQHGVESLDAFPDDVHPLVGL
jgi:hypothetical protein